MTQEYLEPQFVIHENENVLECSSYVSAKFAHELMEDCEQLPIVWSHLHRELVCSPPAQTFAVI